MFMIATVFEDEIGAYIDSMYRDTAFFGYGFSSLLSTYASKASIEAGKPPGFRNRRVVVEAANALDFDFEQAYNMKGST